MKNDDRKQMKKYALFLVNCDSNVDYITITLKNKNSNKWSQFQFTHNWTAQNVN